LDKIEIDEDVLVEVEAEGNIMDLWEHTYLQFYRAWFKFSFVQLYVGVPFRVWVRLRCPKGSGNHRVGQREL